MLKWKGLTDSSESARQRSMKEKTSFCYNLSNWQAVKCKK